MSDRRPSVVIALATLLSIAVACRRSTPERAPAGAPIDRDLLDVTVAQRGLWQASRLSPSI